MFQYSIFLGEFKNQRCVLTELFSKGGRANLFFKSANLQILGLTPLSQLRKFCSFATFQIASAIFRAKSANFFGSPIR
jgi:hypothetical protein